MWGATEGSGARLDRQRVMGGECVRASSCAMQVQKRNEREVPDGQDDETKKPL